MQSLKKHYDIVILAAVILNILFVAYVAFFKKDSFWLETLKVGGSDNMQLVQQLYNSDTYKTQQTSAIQQAIASFTQKSDSTGQNAQ